MTILTAGSAPPPRTYLFAGGGTGGHLTPGLAVAAELRRQEPNCRVLFVGSERAIERTMIASSGFEHIGLPVEPLPTLRRHPVRFVWRNWRAWRESGQLLQSTCPAVVVGLGGFASAPLVAAANRRSIPTVLLEQNTIPGKANRWLARRAFTVCLALEEAVASFDCRCRTTITGNPLRAEVLAAGESPNDGSGPQTLLILGGSQGAAGLNAAVREMVFSAPERWRERRIIHQTGPFDFESFQRFYAELGINHAVSAFFDRVWELYAASTIVVSRAGATTLAELACVGRPVVLVPFPQAADDHQVKNARHYVDAGGALLVLQDGDPRNTGRALWDAVEALWADAPLRKVMADRMREAARPDATRAVVRVLQSAIASRIN